jgi:uroporphyrinogen-III synthase
MNTDYVTRAELAELVETLRRELREAVEVLTLRMDRLERRLNAITVVLGTTQFIILLVVLLILRKIGL